jgi:hypothetical protein
MEYMGNRKFKIKKGQDINGLIEKLGLDEIIIDLPDTKETYKALSIFDWDFVEENTGEGIDLNIKEKTIPASSTDINTSFEKTIIKDFNTAATFLEAGYRLAKKSPDIIYGSNLWVEEMAKLYDIVGSEVLAIDHTLTTTFLSSFYNCFLNPDKIEDRDEMIEDLSDRLKKHWKEAQNHPSMISFIHILFK